MNDFAFGVRVHFMTSRNESLEDIARALTRTPNMPLKGDCPIDLTRAAFGLERLSRLQLGRPGGCQRSTSGSSTCSRRQE